MSLPASVLNNMSIPFLPGNLFLHLLLFVHLQMMGRKLFKRYSIHALSRKRLPVVVEIVFMNQNSYRKSFFSNRVDWGKHFKDFVDWEWSSTLMTTSANVVQTSVTNTANNQSLNYALPNDQDTGSKFCSVKEKKPDSIGTLNSTKRIVPDNIIFNQHFSFVFLRV